MERLDTGAVADLDAKDIAPNVADGVDVVDPMVSARREFNVHFATFWHLTHLAVFDRNPPRYGPIWMITNSAGQKWRAKMNSIDFKEFNGKLCKCLDFMDEKLSWQSTIPISEKILWTLQNYDKCLKIVTAWKNEINNDEADPIQVCAELISRCNIEIAIESFKPHSIALNHLFVSRIHQLLLLAKDCTISTASTVTCISTLENLFSEHAKFTATLSEHFFTRRRINSTSLTNSVVADEKLFQPVVPLDSNSDASGKRQVCRRTNSYDTYFHCPRVLSSRSVLFKRHGVY